MKNIFRTSILAGAVAAFGSVAHASYIDFTDNDAYGVGIIEEADGSLSGSAAGGWTGVADPNAINLSEDGPGTQSAFVQGENDGLGITDDEVSFDPAESFTITFDSEVTIVGLYFLDHFGEEEVHLSIDGNDEAPLLSGLGNDTAGATEFEGLSLTGTTFVFTVGEPNEAGATADYALAAIDLAPIPLPAGILLLGGALGLLGAARRRA